MQCTDRKRIVAAVAGWGVLGVFITRIANFVDRMKRPEALARVRDFLGRRGNPGAIVLAAYNEVNPFGVSFDADLSDAYVDCAEEFMELWGSSAHTLVGSHGRVWMLVSKSFALFGYDERTYLPCVSRIAERIWWRGFSDLDNRKET